MAKKELLKTLRRFVDSHAVAHALPRTIECLVLRDFSLKPPILDLGCGDGTFGRICLGKGKIDVGLDPDKRVIAVAAKSQTYQKVVLAGGGRMPFPNEFFATIVSNSVLEHIKDLKPVFQEARRILKSGGRFIFLVPGQTASDYFFYEKKLRRVGLGVLGKKYTRLKNHLFQYAHLESRDWWQKMARENGFKIISVKGLISPQLVELADMLSPLALPGYFLRKIIGRRLVIRPDFVNRWLARVLVKYCQQPVKENEATAWCFELEKK